MSRDDIYAGDDAGARAANRPSGGGQSPHECDRTRVAACQRAAASYQHISSTASAATAAVRHEPATRTGFPSGGVQSQLAGTGDATGRHGLLF
jgi:hypothetical protein